MKFLRWLKSAGIWIVARLPLFSGLQNSTFAGHWSAFLEFLFLWSLSLLPLLAATAWNILHNLTQMPGEIELKNAFFSNLRSGEVFIYANALLGPVAFVIVKHGRDGVKLPNQMAMIWLLFAVLAASSTMFAWQRAQTITNTPALIYIATTIYALTVLLRYLSLVYDHDRNDFLKLQRRQEDDLMGGMQGFNGN